MAKYIDLDKLNEFPIRAGHYDQEHGNEHFIFGIEAVLEYAEQLPPADVEPVRHGRIIESWKTGRSKRKFSCCGTDCTTMTQWMWPKYCPYCGARMDIQNGGDNDEAD